MPADVRTVALETPSGLMDLYEAVPAEGRATGGAVIVAQEAFGVNRYVESVAERLAGAGHLAVAPHLFHRTGDPVLPYDDFSRVRPHMGALTVAGLLEDLDAALAHLAAAGHAPETIGIIGFCMGGTVALMAAVHRPLGAAVTFYGGGIAEGRFGLPPLVELAPSLRAPWLGVYGDRDRGITTEQVESLRAAAARAPVPTEVVRFPEAGHGFHTHERPDAYHPESATRAWELALAWLDRLAVAAAR